jgi:hypothetical protein
VTEVGVFYSQPRKDFLKHDQFAARFKKV